MSLAGEDLGQRVGGVELRASLDDLPFDAPRTIENIPVTHAFERVVGGQNAGGPKLEIAAGEGIQKAGARVAADHSCGGAFAGPQLFRLSPSVPMVAGPAKEGDVDGI